MQQDPTPRPHSLSSDHGAHSRVFLERHPDHTTSLGRLASISRPGPACRLLEAGLWFASASWVRSSGQWGSTAVRQMGAPSFRVGVPVLSRGSALRRQGPKARPVTPASSVPSKTTSRAIFPWACHSAQGAPPVSQGMEKSHAQEDACRTKSMISGQAGTSSSPQISLLL